MGQVRPTARDGGYDAIRGFAFQFDATFLEVFANPTVVIEVEGEQDISRDDFYIQVKLRSARFSLSRIALAVKQIIKQFVANTDRRYRLFCHFEDQVPGTVLRLTQEQLEQALGDDAKAYDEETKKLFIDSFEIKFAADFQAQFAQVLEALKSRHSLRTDDEAIAFHAILSQHLTTLILTKPAGLRKTSARQLDGVVAATERAIFYSGYQRHLGRQKYLALLKGQVQNKSVNVVRRQRLVIVEVGPGYNSQDAIDFAAAVSTRFHVKSNSPQPYLMFRGIADVANFKQELWDAGVLFTDGTNFHGDRFRLEDLTGPVHASRRIRLVDETRLSELMDAIKLQEAYEFFSTGPVLEGFEGLRFYQMAVDSVGDAVTVMEVGGKR